MLLGLQEEERLVEAERLRLEKDQKLAMELAAGGDSGMRAPAGSGVAQPADASTATGKKQLEPTDSWALPYFREYELLIEVCCALPSCTITLTCGRVLLCSSMRC